MNPNSAKNVIVTAPLAALKRAVAEQRDVEHRVRRPDARRTTNASRGSALTANPASVAVDVQPCSGASMIVQVSAPSIATERPRPGRSSGGTAGVAGLGHQDVRRDRPSSRASGDERPEDAAPGEVLEQQRHRSPVRRRRRCRRRRPRRRAPPRARCRSRKVLLMIDNVVGKISAAAAPIANRAAISAPASSRPRAPTTLAAAKPTSPRISAGRRPKRSERLPAASTSAAKARL